MALGWHRRRANETDDEYVYRTSRTQTLLAKTVRNTEEERELARLIGDDRKSSAQEINQQSSLFD